MNWTALHWAAFEGHKDIVIKLLAHGANPNRYARHRINISIGYEYCLSISLARARGYSEIARILEDQTGTPKKNHSQSKHIITPLPKALPLPGQAKKIEAKHDSVVSNNPSSPINTINPIKISQPNLESLIGLDAVKSEVKKFLDYLHVQKIRQGKGLSVPDQSLHMVFTGNPGTGKTTIARMISQTYKDMGILTKGQFIETDRSGLVGGYLGQTAIKTRKVVGKAVGGVLFIDEAYSLTGNGEGQDSYGQEAIATLLKLMEDHRSDLVIIVAGYTEPMQKFIRSNPGLQSRFNKFLHFDDYSPAELVEIFESFARQSDYKLSAATGLKLGNVFTNLYRSRDETFGNARLARNLFEKAINNHASRMVAAGTMDEESLVTLQPEDISV